MYKPKILTVFRWEINILILCLFLGIAYGFIDAVFRRIKYQSVKLDNSPVRYMIAHQGILVCQTSNRMIYLVDIITQEIVWREASTDQPNRFIPSSDHDGVFLVGNGLGFLSQSDDGWRLNNGLSKSDLIRNNISAFPVEFVGRDPSMGNEDDQIRAIMIDGRPILGYFEDSGGEFKPLLAHETNGFVLLHVNQSAYYGENVNHDFYLYKVQDNGEDTLNLMYCTKWEGVTIWPGLFMDDVILRRGYSTRFSLLGSIDVETIEKTLIEDCNNPVVRGVSGKYNNVGNARLSLDGQTIFAVLQSDTPVEYDLQNGSEAVHRDIIGIKRYSLAGKGLGVTSVYVDWDSNSFYLGTARGEVFISKLNRAKR